MCSICWRVIYMYTQTFLLFVYRIWNVVQCSAVPLIWINWELGIAKRTYENAKEPEGRDCVTWTGGWKRQERQFIKHKITKNNTILKNIIISSHIGTRTSEGRDCVTWTGGERDKRRQETTRETQFKKSLKHKLNHGII